MNDNDDDGDDGEWWLKKMISWTLELKFPYTAAWTTAPRM
jgi:hypothetical protein